MSTIRKRGKGYQIDYFDPTGKRVRKSFKKKKDAEAELGKRVSLIAEGRYLDKKKEYTTMLGELITKYKEGYKDQASFRTAKRHFLKSIAEYFGENTLLANIRYHDLETYRNHLKQKLTQHDTPRKTASVNREMSCFRHMMRKAFEWEMVEQSSFEKGKSLQIKENNMRIRYLAAGEISQLLEKCPTYLQRIVVCAINTGMRKGEILNLKWDDIKNGFIYLYGQMTKTKDARQIPVSDDLQALLMEIRREQHLTSEYVFTYKGRRVDDVKTAFNAATKRAGIMDFKFHDLRHTCASHMAMNGASMKEIQEILGHKTMTMTLRYAHLSSDHKKKAVNRLNGLAASFVCHKTVTNLPQGVYANL